MEPTYLFDHCLSMIGLRLTREWYISLGNSNDLYLCPYLGMLSVIPMQNIWTLCLNHWWSVIWSRLTTYKAKAHFLIRECYMGLGNLDDLYLCPYLDMPLVNSMQDIWGCASIIGSEVWRLSAYKQIKFLIREYYISLGNSNYLSVPISRYFTPLVIPMQDIWGTWWLWSLVNVI